MKEVPFRFFKSACMCIQKFWSKLLSPYRCYRSYSINRDRYVTVSYSQNSSGNMIDDVYSSERSSVWNFYICLNADSKILAKTSFTIWMLSIIAPNLKNIQMFKKCFVYLINFRYKRRSRINLICRKGFNKLCPMQ